MTIRFIITGGTIDKKYDRLDGSLVFSDTQLPDMLAQAGCTVDFVQETVFLADSLHLSDADRLQILAACRAAPEERLIVTHGTDTLTDTAQLLGRELSQKTAVLVGAMVPYAFGASDALFNLGTAVAAVQVMPPGVYVAMNGRIFTWDNVRKNRDRGVFEEKA